MPSLNRRKEQDLRADRFESEVRVSEHEGDFWNNRKKAPFCNRCKKIFEEQSRVCPRCDRKDEMGYIAQIPEKYVEEANRKAIERARRRINGTL